MGETNIEWADYVFNPWWGCAKVSPACGLPLRGEEGKPHGECYAKTLAARFGYGVGGTHFPIWGQHERRRFFGEDHWHQPIVWNRAAAKAGRTDTVFCGSMCDILERHDDPQMAEARRRVFRMVPQTASLIWLFLTKRPENLDLFPVSWQEEWPRNAMFGFTAENQEWFEKRYVPWSHFRSRWNGLRTFMSCEPLLGPLDVEYPDTFNPAQMCCPGTMLDECGCRGLPVNPPLIHGIDWVICGGESGPGARPMNPAWAQSLRDQCVRAGVPFFFKQWGEWAPLSALPDPSYTHVLRDGGGYRHSRCGCYRVGKKQAGRVLDGREWNEMPAVLPRQ